MHAPPQTLSACGINYGFDLSAQQNANDLQASGNKVIACRISSVQDFDKALTSNGLIDGGVIYYGHSGPYDFTGQNGTVEISILAPGQGTGIDTNIGQAKKLVAELLSNFLNGSHKAGIQCGPSLSGSNPAREPQETDSGFLHRFAI